VSEAVAAWAGWMGPVALQAALLAGAAAIADRLLRDRAWPQLRHALWILVGLRLALPASFASPVAVVRVPAAHAAAAPAASAPWLLAAWLAGALLLGAGALVRGRRVRHRLLEGVRGPSDAVRHELRRAAARLRVRPPRLRVIPHARSPFVFGLLRPTVVVPASLRGASLRYALVHELAHVRRRDLWAQALFDLLRIVWWFHPAAWLARSRAHALREVCCDATVARVLGPETPAYRAALLDAAAHLVPARAGAGLLFGSTLLQRLRWLERGPERRRWPRWAVTAAACVALFACAAPGPPLLPAREDALASARRAFAAALADPHAAGCFRLRFAAARLHSLEHEKDQ